MYAVIKTGGKQYKVSQGDTIRVEKLLADEGETVSFSEVLMIADGDQLQFGAPFIESTSVTANVKKHGRGKKIEIVKFKRRKHHRKQMGHRQNYTEVEITAIGGATAVAPQKATSKAKQPVETASKPSKATSNILSKPEGKADDLKKISGVGPKLEEKLNAAGVFHYWQIAKFTAEEIAKIDDQLNFKGRIERDEWVKQAKTLMEEQ